MPQTPRNASSWATTNAWSSSCGSPDTAIVPTTPVPRIVSGKAPPWAAKASGL